MNQGDLLCVLKEYRPCMPLELQLLLSWQVADGMDYLATELYVITRLLISTMFRYSLAVSTVHVIRLLAIVIIVTSFLNEYNYSGVLSILPVMDVIYISDYTSWLVGWLVLCNVTLVPDNVFIVILLPAMSW